MTSVYGTQQQGGGDASRVEDAVGYAEALRLAVCRQLMRVAGAQRVLLRDRHGEPVLELGESPGRGGRRFWKSRVLLDGSCLVLCCERREQMARARAVLIRAAEELESAVEIVQLA